MEAAKGELRNYLERITEVIGIHAGLPGPGGVQGYVLRNGREFESQELTPAEQKYLDTLGWRRHPPRACWPNAQRACLTAVPVPGMKLLYTEGYVWLDMKVPIAHAWLSLNGKMADTTIRHPHNSNGRMLGLIAPGWEYYGVEMDPNLCLHQAEHTEIGPMIDDYLCRWPMLKREGLLQLIPQDRDDGVQQNTVAPDNHEKPRRARNSIRPAEIHSV